MASSPTISGTMKAAIYNATTAETGYELGGMPVLFLPAGDALSVAVGEYALAGQSSTNLVNTAVGYVALQDITTGAGSTAVGAAALQSDTGYYNTGIGYVALQHMTSGTWNTALGTQAMQGASADVLTGSYNTAIGQPGGRGSGNVGGPGGHKVRPENHEAVVAASPTNRRPLPGS